MVDNIEYTINHGLSYETASYLQNMGDGRLMPVPVRAIALDFPRFAIMHDHAAAGDRIEYNGLEYQIVGPVRRYLGWAIFQVKQAMARGATWVPNFTPGAPRARDIVQRAGGVVLLDAPGNSIGPGVTFSRADQAMVCDEVGDWTWTALPYRRSFDVQTKEWGYLFEPQRTNLFKERLALAASSGSPSVTYVSGQIGDMRYVDYTVTGTSTAAPWYQLLCDRSNTAPAGATTLSVFAQLIRGDLNGATLELSQSDATGGQYQVTPTSSPSRYSIAKTANPSSTFGLAIVDSAAAAGKTYDFTLRVWGPQLETGAVATPPPSPPTARPRRLLLMSARSRHPELLRC